MAHRRTLTACVAAAALLSLLTTPALAECWPPTPGRGDTVPIDLAFTATVEEVSRDVDPPMADAAAFDWHVDLAVTGTYRGDVPERLALNGWDVGCSFLRPDGLRKGDRLFITLDQLDLQKNPSLYGQMLIWRRAGDRWEFAEDALDYGSDKGFYPNAARTATTTTEILRLVSAAPAPDTSTLEALDEQGRDARIPALVLVFMAGCILALKRGSRAPSGGTRSA